MKNRWLNEKIYSRWYILYAINLYDKNLMTVRGKGKYTYKQEERKKGEEYISKLLKQYFPKNKIIYFS